MKTVQVPRAGESTFTAHLKMPSGAVRLVPGFSSEHEAQAWLIQTTRLFYAADPRLNAPSREKRH